MVGGSFRRSHTNERALVSAACTSDSWLAEDRRQARGDANRIADATRLNEERLGRGRCREGAALTVDDRATLRVENDRAGVLTLGELVELTVLDHHQPAEATDEAAEREGEDRRQHEDARPDGRILH